MYKTSFYNNRDLMHVIYVHYAIEDRLTPLLSMFPGTDTVQHYTVNPHDGFLSGIQYLLAGQLRDPTEFQVCQCHDTQIECPFHQRTAETSQVTNTLPDHGHTSSDSRSFYQSKTMRVHKAECER